MNLNLLIYQKWATQPKIRTIREDPRLEEKSG